MVGGVDHSTVVETQPCSRGDTLQKYVGRLPTESVDEGSQSRALEAPLQRTIQLVSAYLGSLLRGLYELILRTVYRRMARVSNQIVTSMHAGGTNE
jgi:hypothetical protein